jgi:hypothetical protein
MDLAEFLIACEMAVKAGGAFADANQSSEA